MKRLWAPWRMEYIEDEKIGECIFCSALEKTPEEGLVLFCGNVSMVVLNKYPYNNGHLLVAPKRHVAELEDLTPEESIDLFRLLRHSTMVLKRAVEPDGFNIGLNLGETAGAGVPGHIHFHIVPRWQGDVNFMPVLADVKVMPEHLSNTFQRLKSYFEKIQ